MVDRVKFVLDLLKTQDKRVISSVSNGKHGGIYKSVNIQLSGTT